MENLAQEVGVSEDLARLWLMKQVRWQINLLVPKNILRSKFDATSLNSNSVDQADLFFLPHERLPRRRRFYKYALTVIDVACSRMNAAKLLTSKEFRKFQGFSGNLKKRPLRWPSVIQPDTGH